MARHWQYLKYVLRHKWFVLLAGMREGVPLWMLILHDWDKFMPDEWIPYARTFYKPDGTKQYVESVDFAYAWMKHQHRNKHHWQYWLWIDVPSHNTAIPLPETDYLVWARGEAQRVVVRNSGGVEWLQLQPPCPSDGISTADPMPDVYRREMLADWIGAGRAVGKPNTWEWYEANKDKMKLNPDTRVWVDEQMARLKSWHEREQRLKSMGVIS
jgi:hypothetical protein